MSTTLWNAQDKAVALLRANLTGGVPVTLGEPGNKENTHVWIGGDVDDWTRTYRLSGLQAHDESYVLQIKALVVRKADDYATPRARLRTILSEIEDTFAAHPQLDGVVSLAVVERITMDEGLTDNNERGIGATVYLRCDADAVT